MSVDIGIERGFNPLPLPASGLDGTVNLVPNSGLANAATNPALPGGQLTASTLTPAQIGTAAFTLVTTTVYAMGILLPRNLPVSQLGLGVVTQGTNTGYWVAIADQGLVIRAVSANNNSPTAASVQMFSVLPANNIAYVTPYTGLYYLCLGVVTSAAGTVSQGLVAPNAYTNAGPPIICATAATAATITPPAVGSSTGALTAIVNTLYMVTA